MQAEISQSMERSFSKCFEVRHLESSAQYNPLAVDDIVREEYRFIENTQPLLKISIASVTSLFQGLKRHFGIVQNSSIVTQ